MATIYKRCAGTGPSPLLASADRWDPHVNLIEETAREEKAPPGQRIASLACEPLLVGPGLWAPYVSGYWVETNVVSPLSSLRSRTVVVPLPSSPNHPIKQGVFLHSLSHCHPHRLLPLPSPPASFSPTCIATMASHKQARDAQDAFSQSPATSRPSVR
jgi:hypothetical protein